MKRSVVLLCVVVAAAALIRTPSFTTHPDFCPLQMEVIFPAREVLPLEPLLFQVRLQNTASFPIRLLLTGDDLWVTVTNSRGEELRYFYVYIPVTRLKAGETVWVEPRLYWDESEILEFIPTCEPTWDPTKSCTLNVDVTFDSKWWAAGLKEEVGFCLKQRIGVTVKALPKGRLMDAFRLIKAVLEREVTDNEALFKRYNIIPPDDIFQTNEQLLRRLKALRNTFADTPYGACAGFFYADILGRVLVCGYLEDCYICYVPTVAETLSAYAWVMEHFPTSCWAHLAHIRAKYLKRFYGDWADRVLSNK